MLWKLNKILVWEKIIKTIYKLIKLKKLLLKLGFNYKIFDYIYLFKLRNLINELNKLKCLILNLQILIKLIEIFFNFN